MALAVSRAVGAFAIPEPAVTRYGFSQTISEIEKVLVEGFGLTALPLPSSLTSATGVIQRSRITLAARAYTGTRIRLARVVTMSGGPIELTDLLVVPSTRSGAPILAIELESDDRERGYAIADLVSMVDEDIANAAQLRELTVRRPPLIESDALVGLMPLGELPAWRRAWASSRPLHAAVDLQHTASAKRAASSYAAAFVSLIRDDLHRPTRDVADRHSAYLRDRRESDPVIDVIARAFGFGFATQLIERVLFPRTLPV